MNKDFLSIADLNEAEIISILEAARRLKAQRKPLHVMQGKTLCMIFQKPSTRTAVSFAVAMHELGGHYLSLNSQDLQIRRGESMADTARTLSRYISGIMIRANRHSDVEELAKHATVPVINGLTDREHPCQVLADILTLWEVFRLKNLRALRQKRLCYVGDGNNVTQSWILAAAILGLDFVVCTPKGFEPDKTIVRQSETLNLLKNAQLTFEPDPQTAVRGASMIYTDVWTSMGKEAEQAHRKEALAPYQLNDALLNNAANDVVVMHCLPAHRGEEITESVMDGPRSIVFPQAENRLHAQKAILLHCLRRRSPK